MTPIQARRIGPRHALSVSLMDSCSRIIISVSLMTLFEAVIHAGLAHPINDIGIPSATVISHG